MVSKECLFNCDLDIAYITPVMCCRQGGQLRWSSFGGEVIGLAYADGTRHAVESSRDGTQTKAVFHSALASLVGQGHVKATALLEGEQY